LRLDSSCPFDDKLEPPAEGWTHAAAVGADTWSVGTSNRAHSPTHVWAGKDADALLDASLMTPVFDVAKGSELSFWHTFAFEEGRDGAVLEISTNGGATWTDLEPSITEGGYNGFIFDLDVGFRRAWTGGRVGAMTRVSARLADFAGAGRQARFRILCDGSVTAQGWFLDDVSVCEYTFHLTAVPFTRGNCNADGKINLSDGVFLLNHLFSGGRIPPCRRACDSNSDDVLNLTDAVYFLNHLFLGGPPLKPPASCGILFEASPLECEREACP
jgi:hypothetical protein